MPEQEWAAILETNLNGTMRACRVFGRQMVERGYGRIINIGSLASFVGLYEVAAYCASKGAVAALTKSLAVEWAKFGVCVNAIAPGVFRTELNSALLDGTERGREFLLRTPMRRFGKVEEFVGSCGVPGVGRSQLCDGSSAGGGRRFSGKRRKPVKRRKPADGATWEQRHPARACFTMAVKTSAHFRRSRRIFRI